MASVKLDWNDVRVALAIYEHGALARAARWLRVDETTVGRRLAALQQALGVTLFVRHPDGYRPTPAGLRLVAAAQPMAAQLASVSQELLGLDTAMQGVVRVTMPESVATHVVLPAWPAFAREHPLVELQLQVGPMVQSLAKRQADIAVRMVRPSQAGLLAKRLGAMPFVAFRAASTGARPLAWLALAAHAATPAEQKAVAKLAPPAARLEVDSRMAVAAAIQAGLGVGYLPRYLGAALGLLEEPRVAPVYVDTWLVMDRQLRRHARMHAVYQFLGDTVAPHVMRKS